MNKITDDMQIFEVGDKLYFDTEKSYINQESLFIVEDIIETDIITYLSKDNEFKLHNSWIDFNKTLKAMRCIGIVKNTDGTFKKIKFSDCVLRDAEWIYKIENINKKEDTTKELFLPSKLTIEPIKNGGIGIKKSEEIISTEQYIKGLELACELNLICKSQEMIEKDKIRVERFNIYKEHIEVRKATERKLLKKIKKLKKQKKNLLKKLIKILSGK